MRLRTPVDWLSHAWPFRAGEAATAKPRQAQRRRASLIESMDFSNLTLEGLLKVEPGLLATKLHIITLRSFREMVGEEMLRWVNVFARVEDLRGFHL